MNIALHPFFFKPIVYEIYFIDWVLHTLHISKPRAHVLANWKGWLLN